MSKDMKRRGQKEHSKQGDKQDIYRKYVSWNRLQKTRDDIQTGA